MKQNHFFCEIQKKPKAIKFQIYSFQILNALSLSPFAFALFNWKTIKMHIQKFKMKVKWNKYINYFYRSFGRAWIALSFSISYQIILFFFIFIWVRFEYGAFDTCIRMWLLGAYAYIKWFQTRWCTSWSLDQISITLYSTRVNTWVFFIALNETITKKNTQRRLRGDLHFEYKHLYTKML